MRQKLLEILSEVLQKNLDPSFHMETLLSELGLDSMDFINFIVLAEEKLGIEMDDSDLLYSAYQTVGQLFHMIEKYFSSLKKCLVLDCDNVLWGGVASEDQAVDTKGVYHAFQSMLVTLYEKGVLLCLCSKNDPDDITAIFHTHPEMPLKEDHIVCSKVNWDKKTNNIKAISQELNLGLDSFVFVDDSQRELSMVHAELPEVETVWADFSALPVADLVASYFSDSSNAETNRTELYRQQKEREKQKHLFHDPKEYAASLETEFTLLEASDGLLPRLSELSQRTNQFNLSNKRYSQEDLKKLCLEPHHDILCMNAKDVFGDMGTVAMAVVRYQDTEAVIEAFMLSCRAFDRGLEYLLLNKIKENAKKKTIFKLSGIYRETEKNKRFSSFYPENGVELYE